MTAAYKDMRGNWRIEDHFDVENNRRLSICTSKTFTGKLVTYATVGTLENGMISHMMYSDFSKTYASTTPARITSKVVEFQHGEVMKLFDEIKKTAAAFYATKDKLNDC